VWYANDQVLASSVKAVQAVQKAISKQSGYKVALQTTMFAGLNVKKAFKAQNDVHVLGISRAGGNPVPNGFVAQLVRSLRGGALKGHEREISPNHILLPEWNGDACPYGAPTAYTGPIPPPLLAPAQQPAPGSYSPSITLIDSGYVWDHTWGTNPLDSLLGHAQVFPTPAQWPNDSGGWSTCPPDVVDANHPTAPTQVDALAGHSNFVAGVLALRCNGPTLNIWNHNGGFIADDLSHVPTELAVLRSLLKSQEAAKTPLIMLTFAFPPLDGILSTAWDAALQQLATINPNFLIVAPAGNQGTTQRRYPASLASPDPRAKLKGGALRSIASPSYPTHVIGVGSLKQAGTASVFTNRGTAADPWVACAAIGENVPSSFLHVDLPPEDSPSATVDFTATNWATWQGTCFAAPKIVAMIAKYMPSATTSPWVAWTSARNTLLPPADPGLGLDFGMLG
jgi:hypothetical protein